MKALELEVKSLKKSNAALEKEVQEEKKQNTLLQQEMEEQVIVPFDSLSNDARLRRRKSES